MTPSNFNLQPKPRYDILDALRGIAAIVIVIYHILEIHGLNKFEQIIPHGTMAVDFFFVLSGFVIGHAYDGRWGKMSIGEFLKRRIIRLQPMVVFGMLLGGALFYYGASELFPIIATTPVWKLLLFVLLGMLLIPMPPSTDIRGWQEMYTIDAPAWSLFYEYAANLLYALVIRRFSTKVLAIFVALCACATFYVAVFTPEGLFGGWVLNGEHLLIGFTRVMYPFFAGLLLYRLKKLTYVKNAFLWCAVMLVLSLFVPRLGGAENPWQNGLYESAAILILFPLIVLVGAGGVVHGNAERLCRFLGGISYPIYLINYPIIYVYSGWIMDSHTSLGDSLRQSVGVFVVIFLTAYAAWKLYDLPVQNYLKRRFLRS